MARLMYGLTAQGRGHLSRVTATAEGLEARGHEVLFVCGGFAARELRASGRNVVRVPVVSHKMRNNAIRLWASLATIGWQRLGSWRAEARVADAITRFSPDTLITDFEQYSVRAARRVGLPILSFTHQQIVTHSSLGVEGGLEEVLARAVIQTAAPRHPKHVLITSFFAPKLRAPWRTTLVGPVLRGRVLEAKPTTGDHVVAYHNDPTGFESLLASLGELEVPVMAYGFEPLVGTLERWKNISFRRPSEARFVEDLRTSRAVVASAGHNLISEAMLLGKPLLVIPNRRNFEQALNATYVERMGGEALRSRKVEPRHLRDFLNRVRAGHCGWRDTMAPGNEAAVDCIERVAQGTA